MKLWDLKREVYTKLLIFPGLRPTGSPELAFFNSLSNTVFASFAQVTQQVRSALTLTAAQQLSFDNYHTAIDQAMDNLATLDQNMDYALAGNLTSTWFAQRKLLLQQVAVNAANEATLENSRDQQLNAALQTALTFNTNITTSQAYETATKTLHELRIRRLLGQPITQALYQQALSVAQQGAAIAGNAAQDAIAFLAPCDQAPYRESEAVEQGRGDIQKEQHPTETTSLQIVPNPTSGLIEVTLPNDKGGLLSIYGANGQKIRDLAINDGIFKASIDLGQFINGLYWIVLTNNAKQIVATAKISVTH